MQLLTIIILILLVRITVSVQDSFYIRKLRKFDVSMSKIEQVGKHAR